MENQPTPQQPTTPEDNIFMVQSTPPPTPEEKRRAALWVTIGLIVGFAIVIAGIFFLLFLWANSAADRYRGETALHINSVAKEVQKIDIDAILNQQDTTKLRETIRRYRQDKPLLDSVILADTTSVLYQSTVEMQPQIDRYYDKMVTFTDSLPNLLGFSKAIEKADNDLSVLLQSQPPSNPADARKLAGSIDNIAKALEESKAPEATVKLRNDLAKNYRTLAEGYRDLATAFEGTQISQAQAERRIDASRRTIDELNKTDVTEEVKQYRDNLVHEGETLIRQL